MSNTPLATDLVSQWLAALRDGSYRQAIGVLHERRMDCDSYCCLGVLKHVAEENGIRIRRALTSDHLDEHDAKSVAGLTYELQRKLSMMNDGGAEFPQIADWLERFYKGYGFARFRSAALSALKDLTP